MLDFSLLEEESPIGSDGFIDKKYLISEGLCENDPCTFHCSGYIAEYMYHQKCCALRHIFDLICFRKTIMLTFMKLKQCIWYSLLKKLSMLEIFDGADQSSESDTI